MTNLDEILERAITKWGSQGKTEDQKWAVRNFQTGAWIGAKSQIKSLILDLIGEDDPIQTRANEIRHELREKIKEL